MTDSILAPHFTLDELLRSRDHPQLAAKPGDLPVEHLLNLSWLAWSVLVPLRDRFGPIQITSGYRPRRLNEAVGGADDSRHLTGQAADFRLVRHPADSAWEQIVAGKVRALFDRMAHYPAAERFHVDIEPFGATPRGLLYVNRRGGWDQVP